MTNVVSVKFKGRGKAYYFDPGDLIIHDNTPVIVETSKGLEFAECVRGNHDVTDERVIPPLRPVIRIATEADLKTVELRHSQEKAARIICREKIREHGLEMKLTDAEYNFDGSKILFFFTADGRVDFRELVKDLASAFHTRIELRQIGVRDEAKMLGGLGMCGRPLCCGQFLQDFVPVSTKMAKNQSLSLNPVKISGTCGRLMCCLRYEEDAYEELIKTVPKIGTFVETPDGYGNVAQVNLLRRKVRVKLDNDADQPKTYEADEIAAVPGGRPAEGEPLPHVLTDVPHEKATAKPEPAWKISSFIESDDDPQPVPPPETRPVPAPVVATEGRKRGTSPQKQAQKTTQKSTQKGAQKSTQKPGQKSEQEYAVPAPAQPDDSEKFAVYNKFDKSGKHEKPITPGKPKPVRPPKGAKPHPGKPFSPGKQGAPVKPGTAEKPFTPGKPGYPEPVPPVEVTLPITRTPDPYAPAPGEGAPVGPDFRKRPYNGASGRGYKPHYSKPHREEGAGNPSGGAGQNSGDGEKKSSEFQRKSAPAKKPLQQGNAPHKGGVEQQNKPAHNGGDEQQNKPARRGGDEQQNKPARKGGDEQQNKPARKGGDEQQNKPARSGGNEQNGQADRPSQNKPNNFHRKHFPPKKPKSDQKP